MFSFRQLWEHKCENVVLVISAGTQFPNSVTVSGIARLNFGLRDTLQGF